MGQRLILREADMKSCFRLLILQMGLFLGVATLPGCCSNRGSAELLERELRWQENEIFNLCDSLEEFKQRLDACRRENEDPETAAGRRLDGHAHPAPIAGESKTQHPRFTHLRSLNCLRTAFRPPACRSSRRRVNSPRVEILPQANLFCLGRPRLQPTRWARRFGSSETAPLYPASEGGTPDPRSKYQDQRRN